jgi:hypothetical protein
MYVQAAKRKALFADESYTMATMSIISTTLKIDGLGKRKFAQFAAMARRLGMTPGDYARELIEDALAMDRAARTSTLDEFLRPVREDLSRIDEAELANWLIGLEHAITSV